MYALQTLRPGLVAHFCRRDFFVYPSLRKAGINFTPIKRITLGFFIASLGKENGRSTEEND